MLKRVLSLVIGFLIPAAVSAGEIRILDSNGLVRAFKDVGEEEACVLVSTDEDMDLKIFHELGFLKEIDGVKVPGGLVQFKGVTAGAWKIDKNNHKGMVNEVRITDADCGIPPT